MVSLENKLAKLKQYKNRLKKIHIIQLVKLTKSKNMHL